MLIAVDERKEALTFTGSAEFMNILAENISGFAQEGVPGDHLHVEYYEDHDYLAASKASLVFALIH